MWFCFCFCVVLISLILGWDVESDYKKWLGAIDVLHKKEAWDRVKLLLFPCLGLACCQAKYLAARWDWEWVIIACITSTCLMVFFWYWTLFDGFYNLARGEYWWFNGKAEGKTDDSVLDKFLRDKPDWVEISIKINGILITTVVYIFLCQ